MREAYDLGCRKLQFIGGEPQLNRDFHKLLVTANTIGFEFIEVFSNLTQLDDETVCYAAQNGICFATSVYSDEPAAHDAITRVKSSHARTIRNLKKLIDKGIETRAATIVIDQDRANVKRTKRFLTALGVTHVKSAQVREFGRGEEILSRPARLEGLCGHCWSGKLCIAPDGTAYPCVMARQWPVGNVLETSLAEIVGGALAQRHAPNDFRFRLAAKDRRSWQRRRSRHPRARDGAQADQAADATQAAKAAQTMCSFQAQSQASS
jgi:MoaA/NifB/PqqE/SkfB family radical SAM enzyme